MVTMTPARDRYGRFIAAPGRRSDRKRKAAALRKRNKAIQANRDRTRAGWRLGKG